ncbi:hypothetical protein EGW08_006225, partial [Elysia chlorotica]
MQNHSHVGLQPNNRKRTCHYHPRGSSNVPLPRKLSKLSSGKSADAKSEEQESSDRNTSASSGGGIEKVVVPPIPPVNTVHNKWARSKFIAHRKISADYAILRKYFVCQAQQDKLREASLLKKTPFQEPVLRDEMKASEDHLLKMNYLSLKKFVLRTPVAPMDQKCVNGIMRLIPPHLVEGPLLQGMLAKLIEEVNELFKKSVQMSNIQHILIKPEVKGLEHEKAGPPPSEPLGMNFMRSWHNLYQERRARLKQNLHILQPTHAALLDLCQTRLVNNKLLD